MVFEGRMKIRKIIIKNFRGIKELDWNLPSGDIFCLIGKGDSSKSTILDAIRYVFFPGWPLLFNDADFHKCNIEEPIFIEMTIADFPEEFFDDRKYGLYLRGWDPNISVLTDEPSDNLEVVLTAKLTIEKDLEPKWMIICDRKPDGIEFKKADRTKIDVEMIGEYSGKEFSWAQGTALDKLTEKQDSKELFANISRDAKNSINPERHETLKHFDVAAEMSQEIATLFGIHVNVGYKSHLDIRSIRMRAGDLALHDGDVPLRQLGLGSRRMLLCGIQKKQLAQGHVTLIDEIESGLEPHRIARLIKHIRDDKKGQYFLTTHSPTVLRELTHKELYIVHNREGVIEITPAADSRFQEHKVQGKIRSSAEAFLSKKIVICEGATEVGFLRGLDDYNLTKEKEPFSYHGIALLDVNGASKIKDMARAFKSLGYIVCVLADGDAQEQFSDSDANELNEIDIKVFMWKDNLCLEQRAMIDLPWKYVQSSIIFVRDAILSSAIDNIKSKLHDTLVVLDEDIAEWKDTEILRKAIGEAAKKYGWFKNITKGEQWYNLITPAFSDIDFLKTDLALKLNGLSEWAENGR